MEKTVLHNTTQKGENILYIIGNGFDLAHGMKTSYENFRQWLNTYEPSAVYRLESLYPNIKDNEGRWCDIEAALGSVTLKEAVEFDKYFRECPDEINGENSSHDAYQCGDNIKMVVDTLPSQLRDWIASVDTKKVCRKFEIAKDAKFLSFNYTNTLEDVYGIDNDVLHLHEVLIDSRPLVVGYGDSIFEHEKYESDNSEVDTDKIRNILSHCRKPVMEILEEPKPKSWFEGLSNISAVIVYGHSCSKVDKPYFEKVANCIKDDAHWVFHVHDENENPYFKAFAEKIKKGSQIYEIINP